MVHSFAIMNQADRNESIKALAKVAVAILRRCCDFNGGRPLASLRDVLPDMPSSVVSAPSRVRLPSDRRASGFRLSPVVSVTALVLGDFGLD